MADCADPFGLERAEGTRDSHTDPITDDRRVRAAHHARLETPNKFEPVWIAKELVYWCVANAPRFAYYVVLRMPMGLDVAASSPVPGARVVRLLYDWQEHISPHTHLTPAALSNTVLSHLGEEGDRLRAAIRYARSGRNGGGR